VFVPFLRPIVFFTGNSGNTGDTLIYKGFFVPTSKSELGTLGTLVSVAVRGRSVFFTGSVFGLFCAFFCAGCVPPCRAR